MVCVLRDEHGIFLGAKTCWFKPIVDVHMGESTGLCFALSWMKDLRYDKVIFELDSKLHVVDGLHSPNIDLTEFGLQGAVFSVFFKTLMLSSLGGKLTWLLIV